MRLVLALAVLPGLGACAPAPVARAEAICRDQLPPASGVSGTARIGVASDGTTTRLVRRVDLDIDAGLGGRDPETVWRNCVLRQSGELPTRPFRS